VPETFAAAAASYPIHIANRAAAAAALSEYRRRRRRDDEAKGQRTIKMKARLDGGFLPSNQPQEEEENDRRRRRIREKMSPSVGRRLFSASRVVRLFGQAVAYLCAGSHNAPTLTHSLTTAAAAEVHIAPLFSLYSTFEKKEEEEKKKTLDDARP
jgi:hypothetical protein